MENNNTDNTSSKGHWSKGTSGNPAGRPPGSRNRSTRLLEALLAGEAEQLTRKLLELAQAGDLQALKLCIDRILPPLKERTIRLDLAPIETPQQIPTAIAAVFRGITDGSLTPGEGETLANILAIQTNVLAAGDLERRVEQLEQTLATRQTTNPDTADVMAGLRPNPSPQELPDDRNP